MPGILAAAPDRTETSSGCRGSRRSAGRSSTPALPSPSVIVMPDIVGEAPRSVKSRGTLRWSRRTPAGPASRATALMDTPRLAADQNTIGRGGAIENYDRRGLFCRAVHYALPAAASPVRDRPARPIRSSCNSNQIV